MSKKQRTVANLIAALDSFEAFTSDLTEDEWATQSLCPDWTIHGLVAHIAAIEHMMAGWAPTSLDEPVPFEKAGEFMAEVADLSGADLHARASEIFATRRAELAALTDEQFDTPANTPVGPQTYGRFLAIRIFDVWVHEQDARMPLGKPGNAGGPVAEQALEEIHGSLGYIVGKKIGLEDGKGITFNLTGPVEQSLHVKVDGRAGVVESLDSPDVTVTTDSLTFCLLACGRIDPQGPIDEGKISWSGDDEIGERAARNLRFTM